MLFPKLEGACPSLLIVSGILLSFFQDVSFYMDVIFPLFPLTREKRMLLLSLM